jgi:hypothetical protein
LVAPGVSVWSLWPNGNKTLLSGTSEAAPHVSGVAALLRSTHPTWTVSNVELALEDSAEDLGAGGFDQQYGHGLVRADRALEVVGTHLSISAPNTTDWGGTARLSGKLSSDNESALATRTLEIMAKPYRSTSWILVATATTDANGVYRASVSPKKRTAYRVHFAREGERVQAYSPIKTITPRAALTSPSVPSSVRRGQTFASVGYVKPRHPRGARSVSIKCYKWDPKRNEYRYHHAESAVNTGYNMKRRATRWAGRVTLPSRGKWKLVARVAADGMHAKTNSEPRFVTVR